jgi:hypothetical protein
MLASDKHSSLFDKKKSLITLPLESDAINVKATNAIKSNKIAHC